MTPLPRTPRRRWAPHEVRATGRALLVATAVELAVRVVPLDRLARRLGMHLAADATVDEHIASQPPPEGPDVRVALDASERAACRAVARVMRRWPGRPDTCLREALLYGHVLRAHNPRLHVGAGAVGDRVLAHAWLSFDSGALGRRDGMFELTSDGR